MMPKALYGAVWVIKNVYCDGAERLTERVLLFTSYRFRLIHSAELLKSPASAGARAGLVRGAGVSRLRHGPVLVHHRFCENPLIAT